MLGPAALGFGAINQPDSSSSCYYIVSLNGINLQALDTYHGYVSVAAFSVLTGKDEAERCTVI
jgi:hypothetical protein